MAAQKDKPSDGRLARFRRRAGSRPFVTLLVANILPLCIGAALAVSYYRGTISFLPGAESVLPSLVMLAATLVALVFLAWVVAPLLGPVVRGASEFVAAQRSAMARGGMVSFFSRLPLLFGGVLVHAVLVANAILVALLILLALAAAIGSLACFVIEIWQIKA
jgi:hypothetical protein